MNRQARDQAIQALTRARQDLATARELFAQADGPRAHRMASHVTLHSRRAEEAARTYLATLDPVPVARCPFTDQVIELHLDQAGLDGPFWDHEHPVRQDPPLAPPLVGLTGAMRLAATIEETPGEVAPGPGKPFLLPDLMAHEEVVATLSMVPVGAHHGYVIAYFCQEVPRDLVPPDTWGLDHAEILREELLLTTRHGTLHAPMDFELEPWIEQGRLRWIEPGDASLTLRQDTQACPYLDLAGREAVAYLEAGQVLHVDPVEVNPA